MIRTDELLCRFKNACGFTSSYQACQKLGLDQAQWASWTSGRRPLPEHLAIRMANVAGLHVGYVLASLAAERAERVGKELEAEAWRSLADQLPEESQAA